MNDPDSWGSFFSGINSYSCNISSDIKPHQTAKKLLFFFLTFLFDQKKSTNTIQRSGSRNIIHFFPLSFTVVFCFHNWQQLTFFWDMIPDSYHTRTHIHTHEILFDSIPYGIYVPCPHTHIHTNIYPYEKKGLNHFLRSYAFTIHVHSFILSFILFFIRFTSTNLSFVIMHCTHTFRHWKKFQILSSWRKKEKKICMQNIII